MGGVWGGDPAPRKTEDTKGTTMIEKLSEYKITSRDGAFINADCNAKIINTLVRKINELVDAVNAIQKEREAERFEIQEWIGILEAVRESVNIYEKQIDELQMKVEPEKCETPAENVQTGTESRPENVQDKFAEQRRWIGKLCKFWVADAEHPTFGILDFVDAGLHPEPFHINCGESEQGWYPSCEPVKPDDDIIYKGE